MEHVNIPSANCHEPKHISDASTGDAGKVITPSASTPGVSVLRFLTPSDIGADPSGEGAAALAAAQAYTDGRVSSAQRAALTALTAIATADAIDPATTMALVNECKAKINAIISALNV